MRVIVRILEGRLSGFLKAGMLHRRLRLVVNKASGPVRRTSFYWSVMVALS